MAYCQLLSQDPPDAIHDEEMTFALQQCGLTVWHRPTAIVKQFWVSTALDLILQERGDDVLLSHLGFMNVGWL